MLLERYLPSLRTGAGAVRRPVARDGVSRPRATGEEQALVCRHWSPQLKCALTLTLPVSRPIVRLTVTGLAVGRLETPAPSNHKS